MSILNDLLSTVKEIDLDQVKQYTGDKVGSVEQYMQRTETKSEPDYVRGFVAGLIGGLVGTGVKMLVDRSMPTDQPQEEHDARAQIVGEDELPQQLLNFGFGALIGGVYGVVAEGMPSAQAPAGVPFGAGLWTATHKLALPLLGLAPGAMKNNAGQQLGQFAGHVAYGTTVEVVRRGVRHVMDEQDV